MKNADDGIFLYNPLSKSTKKSKFYTNKKSKELTKLSSKDSNHALTIQDYRTSIRDDMEDNEDLVGK